MSEDTITLVNQSDPVQVVVVEDKTIFILPEAGLQGPSGDVGGFNYVQNTPVLTDTINHNLGRRPVVEFFTVGGVMFLAAFIHLNNNQVQVTFNSAQAFTARMI